MNDNLFIALQRVAPQHLISRVIGRLGACENHFIKDTFIRRFADKYEVNMAEAEQEDLNAYPSFNAFFTRALKAGARPIDPAANALVSPADGVLSQIGAISEGRIIQAKSQWFSAAELLASTEDAELFAGGAFATVYLSPRDYHRVHMPYGGRLKKMTYVPGRLFSVNESTARHVPRLFARNERVVCLFETEFGPLALVLVGAMIVASIETVWAGAVPPVARRVRSHEYGGAAPELAKGEEMGRFFLGSTAIVLCPKGTLSWQKEYKAGAHVMLGERLGTVSDI